MSRIFQWRDIRKINSNTIMLAQLQFFRSLSNIGTLSRRVLVTYMNYFQPTKEIITLNPYMEVSEALFLATCVFSSPIRGQKSVYLDVYAEQIYNRLLSKSITNIFSNTLKLCIESIHQSKKISELLDQLDICITNNELIGAMCILHTLFVIESDFQSISLDLVSKLTEEGLYQMMRRSLLSIFLSELTEYEQRTLISYYLNHTTISFIDPILLDFLLSRIDDYYIIPLIDLIDSISGIKQNIVFLHIIGSIPVNSAYEFRGRSVIIDQWIKDQPYDDIEKNMICLIILHNSSRCRKLRKAIDLLVNTDRSAEYSLNYRMIYHKYMK